MRLSKQNKNGLAKNTAKVAKEKMHLQNSLAFLGGEQS